MHDLVIRSAHICDALGSPLKPGGLAVSGNRIVSIGDDVGPARQVVDADGLVLAPGIIDTHTHYDAQITWNPMVDPSPGLGVTTVVIGNCGFTIAPCKPEDRDLTMSNLVRVEGMSIEALRAGIDWSFESFPEYLRNLENRGAGPNVAAFVGHSSVRTFVMGEDAPRRAASDEEIRQMAAIVRDAMKSGAVGFATSTSPSHNGASGDPMPSRLADEREMSALVGVLGECERGVFMLTKGGGTSVEYLESLAADEAGVHPLDWLLDLSLDEGLQTTFAAVLLNSDEQAVGRLLTDPYSTIALSDAGAHLTFFCDAGFGLHLLGHWVREKSVMPLEKTVRRIGNEIRLRGR